MMESNNKSVTLSANATETSVFRQIGLENHDLYQSLKLYGQSDVYPFHMPGHKRNPEFLDFGQTVRMDITEIDGFDNMHHASGIIDAAQKRAARLYGADETWFLVNGSSCGLIAAILGSCERGGRILMARNCHKSVYNAVEMGNLEPIYIYPQLMAPLGIYGSVDPEEVRALLTQFSDIQAVVITSPTYEGVVSDIAAIAEIVHSYHIPLIVDEAHGAHFGFSEAFPQTAVRCGADVVVQSAHKTLPSLTQTSLIHLNGDICHRKKIRKYYDFLQTTSPSYIMMASLDHCMTLLEQNSSQYFDIYQQMLTDFLEKCRNLKHLHILEASDMAQNKIFDFDMSKIDIYSREVCACGKWIYSILLNRYHIQLEMAARDDALAMTSFCDTQEGFDRLYAALVEMDRMPVWQNRQFEVYDLPVSMNFSGICPKVRCGEAVEMSFEVVDFEHACGRLSAEYAYIYPPGVPFLVPGEQITDAHLDLIRSYKASGFEIEGPEDADLRTLNVLKL